MSRAALPLDTASVYLDFVIAADLKTALSYKFKAKNGCIGHNLVYLCALVSFSRLENRLVRADWIALAVGVPLACGSSFGIATVAVGCLWASKFSKGPALVQRTTPLERRAVSTNPAHVNSALKSQAERGYW
jgi:hypothetical protein